MDLPQSYLSTEQAAAFLGCSPKTLEADRCRRRWGVPFLRLGRRIVYDAQALKAWLEAQQAAPTAGKGG